jgi:Xaa-Pro aminopeptidase
MKITLKRVPFDISPGSSIQPQIPQSEYEVRADALYEAAGKDWVIVYGDREHTANLAYACGFDPRFEEAMLALGPEGQRILAVGNEGLGYTQTFRLQGHVVLCQSFSLMGQPRSSAPRLTHVLREMGLTEGSSVGLIGWKYLEPDECDEPTDSTVPSFVPAMLVTAVKKVVGERGQVTDATAAMMHPTQGIKSRNSAAQIAAFEWAAARASACVFRALQHARPGMSEHDVAVEMRYEGDPLTCHTMMTTAGADAPVIGLCSPTNRVIQWGDGASMAMGLRGSLCARAGLIRDTPDDSFFTAFVQPYFSAIAAWWTTMHIGITGDAVNTAVMSALSGSGIQPLLNPGHLVSIDEWTHTPIRPASTEQISSGMVFQCDVIPTPMPNGTSLNCEDTVAIADESLRAQIRSAYPEVWSRIERRRALMQDALGIALAAELLPLSIAPACLPPFWMSSEYVCALEA